MDQLLRVREVEALTRLSHGKVYQLLASGEIPSVVIGRSRRVPESELRRWMERLVADQVSGDAA